MARDSYNLGQVQMRTTQGGPRGGMRAAEKPKDFKNSCLMVLRYSKKLMPLVIIGVSCSIISVLLILAGPETLKNITNLISEGMASGQMDLNRILRMTLILLALYLLAALIAYGESYSMTTYSSRLSQIMRNDISRKLNRIPLSRSDSSSFGDLLSRVTNDVDTLNMALDRTVSEVISAVLMFLGCAVMMLITNFKMGLVAIGFALIGFSLMRLLIRKSQPYFVKRSVFLG